MSYYIGLSLFKEAAAAGKKPASAEAMRILSLLEGRPVKENDIARTARGRPFLPGREIDFNISHSAALTAVSLVRGGNLRAGCDVERIRNRSGAPGIAENFFSASENHYLFDRGFDEARFYEIWTLKECFLKLRGLSVFDMAAAPSFISGEGQFAFGAAVSSALYFRLYELSSGAGERYILAAAVEGARQPSPEIRWFSQSTLDCKIIAEINAAPNPAQTVSPKI